jgi:predicted secreted hydrolase
MSKIHKIPYKDKNHGDFEEEWCCHKKASEWWYATGYFTDADAHMYSFQLTLINPHIFGVEPYIIMLALTDFRAEKHYYSQKTKLLSKSIVIDKKTVSFGNIAKVVKGKSSMILTASHNDFSLDLKLDYGKGAFWHCDNGVLRMGLDAPKETTTYYSYTNMPTTGTMTLNGKKTAVNGKSWFDKQGGTYHLLNRKTHWEWFSLRFFDDEEMMLFTFPQSNYQDGTYISEDGTASRLIDYNVIPLDFVTVNGSKYSTGWTLSVKGLKEEEYTITPLMKGQINLGYYEQLAWVYNQRGEKVGMCFVELLPGVYNEKYSMMMLFKKVD